MTRVAELEAQTAAMVAAAYRDAASVLGEDKQDEWPASAILDRMPMDARAFLDALLATARAEGVREGMERAAKECERNIPASVLDQPMHDHKTVDQCSARTLAARIRARGEKP